MNRRVEDELRDSQERLQQALDAAGMGTFIWRVQTDEGEPDERMLAIYGLPPGGELNLRVVLGELIHPDDRRSLADAVAGSIDPNGTHRLQLDFRLIRPSGEVRWVNLTGKVFFEGDPPVADRMVGAAMDITERKRIEEALRESEEKYRRLFQSMDQGFALIRWVRDEKGEVIDHIYEEVNPALRELTDVKARRLIGRRASEVVPDDLADWLPVLRRVAAGEIVRTEQYNRSVGRWFDVALYPAGRERAMVLSDEITERKRAEEALRESEERFRQFSEASSDLLWIRNAESLAFEYVSPAFDTLFGVKRERVLRRNTVKAWLELVHPEDRDEAISRLRALRRGSACNHEYRIIRPDGEVRWLHNTDFPIVGRCGRLQRIAGIAQDVTERKRAVELQETLLAELQHRVRNIMAMMRSMVRRTAMSKTDLGEFVRHFERRIEAMARTQALLTREPGRGVDLEGMLREEMYAQEADEAKVKLEGPIVKLAPHAAEVLTLALHELATNSVKYGALGEEAGSIRVSWDCVPVNGEKWLRLIWDEAVAAPIESEPRPGFGTELITRRIPYELHGRSEMRFSRNGLRAVIEFPLGDGESILQTDSAPVKEAAG